MGCKYYGYDCDITTTFPANGKFNDMQRMVYETVLHALEAVEGSMRPHVSWLVRIWRWFLPKQFDVLETRPSADNDL